MRSVCWDGDRVIAGTRNGELVEVVASGTPVHRTRGHGEGELWGLAPHPHEHLFITARLYHCVMAVGGAHCCLRSDDRTIRLWNSESHRLVKSTEIPVAARSAAYHPSGNTVAIGLSNGSFIVLESPSLRLVRASAWWS